LTQKGTVIASVMPIIVFW